MLFLKKVLLNLFLAAVAFCLGVALYQSWTKEFQSLPTTGSLREEKSREKQQKHKRIVPPKASYGAVTERNLFSPDRKEFIPEKPVSEDKPEIKKVAKVSGQAVKLFGVIQLGDKKSALVSNPLQKNNDERKNTWVTVGDRIGNLRVVEIAANKIRLRDDKDQYEIMLHDDKKKKHESSSAARTEPMVILTGTSSKQPVPTIQPENRQPDDDFIMVNTPFGPVKRRKK